MKILIIKPSSLGDVVQAMPVLRLLRLRYPDARITWWLAENLLPLLEDDPDLDEVIPFARSRGFSMAGVQKWFANVARIRRESFDLVIDLQGLLRSGSFAWLAGGGRLVGLDLRREGARMFYDVAVARPQDRLHAVDWYFDVAKEIGLDVSVDYDWIPERASAAKRVARKLTGNSAEIIALIPGARWDNKRWPPGHFASAVGFIAKQKPTARFVIIGGSGDRELAREINSLGTVACLDLTGRTSIPEMIECLRRCRLVITNDTGPMHIAAALGRPVIGVFGPTDPGQTGPYGSNVRILRGELPCAPCMKSTCRWDSYMECLRSVSAVDVARAACDWL